MEHRQRRHRENFINAVRSRRSTDIASRIRVAERSAAIAHLANLSHRTGKKIPVASMEELTAENPILQTILSDQGKQLSDWGITAPEYNVGRVIDFDPVTTKITTPDIDPTLIQRHCRPDFKFPDLG